MKVSVRRCVRSEVDVIAEYEPPGQAFPESKFRAQEQGSCHFLVAWHGGDPVGSAELTTDDVPELKNLNVRESHRREGIGTQLITAAEVLVGPSGSLSIGVSIENPSAARLYERLGYRPTGQLSMMTYEYVDSVGRKMTATETSEMLIKRW